jgi:sortase A
MCLDALATAQPNLMKSLHRIERLLLLVGLTLLVIYVAARVHGGLLSRAAILTMSLSRDESSAGAATRPKRDFTNVDYSLWSEKRIEEYKMSLAQHFDPPLAMLRVGKIHLEVPVLEGTDDLILNRGVGRIAGTARLGTNGNVGIAGHRDGFFRGLKDIGLGDTMDLVMPSGTETYVVNSIQIVDPKDVSVLQPTNVASLTLVTCYPFYFIGSAPQRYIVHAALADADRLNNNVHKLLNSTVTIKNKQEITK